MEFFITGFLLSLSLCLDIGIVNVALINTAIRSGKGAALLLGLGSCFGDLFYAVLSLLGIGLLLHHTAVRWVLWLGGGAVLLYLSGAAAHAALHSAGGTAEQRRHDGFAATTHFMRGLLLALASPTSLIWFAAVGGSLIAQSGAHSGADLFALLSGFFCAGLAWSAFLASLAAYGGQALGARFRQYCQWLSAALFLYFAVRVLVAGYRQLL